MIFYIYPTKVIIYVGCPSFLYFIIEFKKYYGRSEVGIVAAEGALQGEDR